MNILSPMPYGNGAYIVHKTLESRIPNYQVCGYNPLLQFFPLIIPFLCRSESVDLIHTTPDYGYLSRRRNTPLVVTFHGFVLDKETRKYSTLAQCVHHGTDLRYFTRKALEVADMVTAVSHFTADLVRAELGYKKEIRVIYNGVDVEKFRPTSKAPKGPIRVLFSGNLTKRKGVDLLPEIARRLDNNIIIQYTSGLRTKSPAFLSDRLINIGSIDYEKMPEVYRQSDILLFPTVREGFGLVAAEAMATGLPVVATNCSSLPELIMDGKGGFLCELGNAAEFANKINLLASSIAMRKEMGQFNRARVEERFTLSRMVNEYVRLFEEVLDAGG